MSILDLEFKENYKFCNHCDTYFEANRSDKKYCSDNCRHKAKYQRNKKVKKVKQKSFVKSKLDYSRLTFLLSVVGFIGSLGFYIGVLRQVYTVPVQKTESIKVLKVENELTELIEAK